MSHYWRDAALLDELESGCRQLWELAVAFKGEPLYYPYMQACQEMGKLIDNLKDQLQAADQNSYYNALHASSKPAPLSRHDESCHCADCELQGG